MGSGNEQPYGKGLSGMERIILFDGVCHFCDRAVQFIIKRDPKGIFKFASLQSEIGSEKSRDTGVPAGTDSIVLIEGHTSFIKSTAALRICRRLSGMWKLLYLFIAVPRPIRDAVYDVIARNRYKWFGRKDQCELPSAEIRSRFL